MKQGKVIKAARCRAQLSQMALASKLGYETPQYISNVERGLCAWNDRKVGKLCKILDLDRSTLVRAMGFDYEARLR